MPQSVYVSRVHSAKAPGAIFKMTLDPKTGALSRPEQVGDATRPSFLAFHPNKQWLYTTNDADDDKTRGEISAFAIDPSSGKLTSMNDQSSQGAGPCFVAVDKTGKNVLVANYGDGVVACLPIESDGKLAPASATFHHEGSGPNTKRQDHAHAHSFFLAPDNRFALAVDLGTDRVEVYKFDADKHALTESGGVSIAPGAGPRHLAFHPNGRFVYVITELSNTVVFFTWNAEKGELHEVQTVPTLPGDFKGTSYCAEVLVHPSGKFLYGTNRGHNSLAAFSIDPKSGALSSLSTTPCGGDFPRNMTIDPTGNYLLVSNERSGNLVAFRIDQQTGALTQLSDTPIGGTLACVRILEK
ncbi:MAG TPA: lactonase family protein [Tepidisphaeraceae bacterium]|nr:lactonase family protein [Tepidisphaeraceae bacterium]